MSVLVWLAGLASLGIWLILLGARGRFWLPHRLSPAPVPADWPEVAAIIPARNEADAIGATLASLFGQSYPGKFSVIVVDDHSEDGTAQVARQTAQHAGAEAAARLSVLSAGELPPGWSGKVWAQAEGLAAAKRLAPGAQYWLLTDADIVHAPGALSALVASAEAERHDLVSLMVRLRCSSSAERALIPAFIFFFAKLYPFRWVGQKHRRTAGAAGGCMLVRRQALEAIGGIEAIRGELIDDCALAAHLKARGSISLSLADETYSTRSYQHAGEIWRMVARTAFTQLRYSPLRLAAAVLGLLLTYAVPPVLTLAGLFLQRAWAWPAAAAWLAMVLAYTPTLRFYGLGAWRAVALPAVAIFYLAATLDSAWRHWRGRGGEWKGRAQGAAVRALKPRPPRGGVSTPLERPPARTDPQESKRTKAGP